MKLLNPKVHFVERKFLTEDQMLRLLKKFKQKKFGFKDYAVEVEEVVLDAPYKQCFYIKTKSMYGRLGELERVKSLNPGSYFHLRIEYIV